MKKILAGIVLYNPDIKRLKQNIDVILPQVDRIILVNNGSENIDEIKALVSGNECKSPESDDFVGTGKANKNIITGDDDKGIAAGGNVKNSVSNGKKIILADLKENKGIAFALDVILRFADKNSYDYFLTLDQDSVAAPDLIKIYSDYLCREKLGLLTCDIRDRNYTVSHNDVDEEDIDYIITSGCLVNTKMCARINGFDAGMFIDYVDFDLCEKVHEAGYEILRTYKTHIIHEVGHSRPVRLFGRPFVVFNQPPLRVYYFFRNGKYVINKHKGKSENLKMYKTDLFRRAVLIMLFENQKMKKLHMIMKGLSDSMKMPKEEMGYREVCAEIDEMFLQ